jgi:hypothetical protein
LTLRDDDQPQRAVRPRVRGNLKPEPRDVATVKDDTFQLRVAHNHESPTNAYLDRLRTNAETAIANGTNLPLSELKYSPLLGHLKDNIEAFHKAVAQHERRLESRFNNQLLRAKDVSIWYRDADEQQQQNEDDSRRTATAPIYYSNHAITKEYFELLTRKGAKAMSDHKTAWGEKYLAWSGSYQHTVTTVMKLGMEGLVALYSFEVLSRARPWPIEQLLRGISELSPLAHTIGLWYKIASGVDFAGMYDPTTNPEDAA